MGEQKHLV